MRGESGFLRAARRIWSKGSTNRPRRISASSSIITTTTLFGGRLRVNRDAAKIEELWNPVVAAWYPGGKDDPEMTLLELQLVDAAIWASKTNPIKFGWEIANANATGEEPEVGVSNHIRFAA